jgi:sterol desaturase/sphingolipid hydroxylase (fatty acid hydroxylase superfamily)
MLESISEFPQTKLYLVSAISFIAMLVTEAGYSLATGKNVYGKKDTAANLAMYAGNYAVNFFWAGVVYQLYLWVHQFSAWRLGANWGFRGWDGAWEWVALFFLEDLCFYWFHRFSHRSRLLWASHVSHHSSTRYNLTTTIRQTWIPFFGVVFWLPLLLIGFDPLMVLTMQALSLMYQSWIHTELIRSTGPLEWVLNTPSHHRVHHGSNPAYLDTNYGGVLIIWDRIFGTFRKETEAVKFGLTRDVGTHNPLVIALHGWRELFRDLRASRGLGGWIKTLLLAPDWKARSEQANT